MSFNRNLLNTWYIIFHYRKVKYALHRSLPLNIVSFPQLPASSKIFTYSYIPMISLHESFFNTVPFHYHWQERNYKNPEYSWYQAKRMPTYLSLPSLLAPSICQNNAFKVQHLAPSKMSIEYFKNQTKNKKRVLKEICWQNSAEFLRLSNSFYRK